MQEVQLEQVTKNSFVEMATGLIHIISPKSEAAPWVRDHYCVDCKVVQKINAATFVVGERCPACWKKNAAKRNAAQKKEAASAMYAALKSQVEVKA